MDQSQKDAGAIAALILRLTEYRLPRAKRLLKRVNEGNTLSDDDIRFLKRVYEDGRSNQSLYRRNPEYNRLLTGFTELYIEIITKGVENEKSR